MREPRYPLPRVVLVTTDATASPTALRGRGGRGPGDRFEFSLALSAPGLGCSSVRPAHGERRVGAAGMGGFPPAQPALPRRPEVTRVRGRLLRRIRQ